MSLELFGFIKDLVQTNPTGNDPKSEGDDHIRGVKATLQTQFPGFTEGVGIILTESQLNGMITDRAGIMFDYAGATIPLGSLECKGQAVKQANYPELYSALGGLWDTTGGVTAPAGDEFRLPPSYNGEGFGLFRRAEGFETVGTQQDDEYKSHTHPGISNSGGSLTMKDGGTAIHSSTGASGGGETRPANITIKVCVWTGK